MVQLFHSAYNLKNSIFLSFWNEIKWNANKPSVNIKKEKENYSTNVVWKILPYSLHYVTLHIRLKNMIPKEGGRTEAGR